MEDTDNLKKLINGRNTAQKVAMRAKIVLSHLEGKSKISTAKALSVGRPTIDLWIKRYREFGVQGLLKDASRPGRKPQIDSKKEKQIVDATLNSTPKDATHWSTRTLAKEQGVSKMAIQRIWKKYNLKPHLIKGFKKNTQKEAE